MRFNDKDWSVYNLTIILYYDEYIVKAMDMNRSEWVEREREKKMKKDVANSLTIRLWLHWARKCIHNVIRLIINWKKVQEFFCHLVYFNIVDSSMNKSNIYLLFLGIHTHTHTHSVLLCLLGVLCIACSAVLLLMHFILYLSL